jgi:hypothetical protein
MIDLSDDKYTPEVMQTHKVFRVTVPRHTHADVKSTELPFIYVHVDRYGCVQLASNSYWPDGPFDEPLIQKAIYEYLEEWELIEKKTIGPEDWEYFATVKLTDASWRVL